VEGPFDRIEVRRVLREISKCSPRALDRLAYARRFVRLQMIEDDDVVAFKRGDQELLDLGPEQFGRHSTFDNHWGDHLVMT
jgi:hypothetical protein